MQKQCRALEMMCCCDCVTDTAAAGGCVPVQWMAAVDTIITKAGPGTIAEALISGLPILLNGNVPCQVRASRHGWISLGQTPAANNALSGMDVQSATWHSLPLH